jgi:hypothetical protein
VLLFHYKLVDGTQDQAALQAPQPGLVQSREILNWFGKILPPSFFESLKQDLGIIGNSCIFTLPVTIWLMVLQRLSQKGTLTTAVTELLHGNGKALLEPCKQVREDRISASTGAYVRRGSGYRWKRCGGSRSEPSNNCIESHRRIVCGIACFCWMAARSGWRILRRFGKPTPRRKTSMANRIGLTTSAATQVTLSTSTKYYSLKDPDGCTEIDGGQSFGRSETTTCACKARWRTLLFPAAVNTPRTVSTGNVLATTPRLM